MATTNFKEKEREAAKKAKLQKKKRRKKRLITAFIVVLIMAVITLCFLSLTVFFKITTVNVSGSSNYTAEEIVSAAGIEAGDNLILLNDKKISEKLQSKLPFIDEVKVDKVLPDKVKLTVKETKEEIYFSNGKDIYSANIKGKIIKKYDIAPENLIMVTVSEKIKFETGSKIIFNVEREEELYNNFFNMLNTYSYDVNFINISDPFASYMKLENRLIVRFGSSAYFQNKSDYLKAALAGISKEAEGIFDLSAWTPDNNQPVLTYDDISSYEK